MEVIENLSEIEDEGEVYETIEDIWPDYPSKEDFLFNEDECWTWLANDAALSASLPAGVLVLWAGRRFAPCSISLPEGLSSAFSGCFISLRWPYDVRLGQTSAALMRAVPYFLPTFAPVFRIHLKG